MWARALKSDPVQNMGGNNKINKFKKKTSVYLRPAAALEVVGASVTILRFPLARAANSVVAARARRTRCAQRLRLLLPRCSDPSLPVSAPGRRRWKPWDACLQTTAAACTHCCAVHVLVAARDCARSGMSRYSLRVRMSTVTISLPSLMALPFFALWSPSFVRVRATTVAAAMRSLPYNERAAEWMNIAPHESRYRAR